MAVLLSKFLSVPSAIKKPSSIIPGDIVHWDNKDWLIVHYDTASNLLYMCTVNAVNQCTFGSSIAYAGSNLAAVVKNYENSQLSAAAKQIIVDTTVNGVTAKAFIPSFEQVSSQFSWFTTDFRRIACYNNVRESYWTSSAIDSTHIYHVSEYGIVQHYRIASDSNTVRPFICVQM